MKTRDSLVSDDQNRDLPVMLSVSYSVLK